jgi:hypothetical protein
MNNDIDCNEINVHINLIFQKNINKGKEINWKNGIKLVV